MASTGVVEDRANPAADDEQSVAHATRKRLRSDHSMSRLIIAESARLVLPARRSFHFRAAIQHLLTQEWISQSAVSWIHSAFFGIPSPA